MSIAMLEWAAAHRPKIMEECAKTRAISYDQMTAEQQSVYRDLLALSSGTLAHLSGYSDYETLDMIQEDLLSVFTTMRHSKKYRFETWMDVWHVYNRSLTKFKAEVSV